MVGYGLIWIASAASSVLFFCFLWAAVGRIGKAWLRRLVSLALVLWVVVSALVPMAIALVARYVFLIDHPWVPYGVTRSMAGLLAVGVVLYFGRGGRYRKWPVLRLLIAFGVCTSIQSGAMYWTYRQSLIRLTALRASCMAELAALAPPRVADEDSAFLAYTALAEQMVGLDDWIMELRASQPRQTPAPDAPFETWLIPDLREKPATEEEARAYITQHDAAIGQVRAATMRPGYSSGGDWTDPMEAAMPSGERRHWRVASDALVFDADWQARWSNVDRAVADVRALWRMADHARVDPDMVGQLLAAVHEALGNKAMVFVINATELSDAQLQSLSHGPRSDLVAASRRTMQLEKAGFTAMLSHLVLTGVGPDDWLGQPMRVSPSVRMAMALFFTEHELAAYRSAMDRLTEAIGTTCAGSYPRVEQVSDEVLQPPLTVFVRMMLPAHGRPVGVLGNMEAERELRTVAIAIARFRAKHGRLPGAIDDLVPEYLAAWPVDPFDEKPMRARFTDAEVTVYSVGMDGVDDDGVDGMAQGDLGYGVKRSDDVTFTITMPGAKQAE